MWNRKTQKAKPRLNLKIVAPIIVLVLIGVAVFVIKFLNGPAEGTVSQKSTQTTYKAEEKIVTPGRYDGKYISFSYPAHFSITSAPKNEGVLESVSLTSSNHSGKQASIGVVKESLGNDSGANYRQSHPEIYTKQSDVLNNLVFTKNKNGSEYTGFLVKDDYVASISLSSTYTKDLSTDYLDFIENWEWK